MKKILFIFISLCLILTSCKGKEEQETEFEFKEKISGVNIYLPKDWIIKTGVYGDYYNDIQNFILYKNIETDNIEKELLESLNFYRHDDFKLNEEFKDLLTKDEIEIERKDKTFKYIKGKKIGNTIIIIASKNKEEANKLYEKVFR